MQLYRVLSTYNFFVVCQVFNCCAQMQRSLRLLNQLAKKNADYVRRRPYEKESDSSFANTYQKFLPLQKVCRRFVKQAFAYKCRLI
jgi:hypothetical protein